MKKTTRLTALLLALVLLLANLSASATETGIRIEDLNAEIYNQLLQAASDDPWGIYGECGEDNVYCGYVNTLINEKTTAQARYEYMMSLDGEDGVDLEFAMAHYYGVEEHYATNVLCTCNYPAYEPEYVPGDISKHSEDCPWHFANLTTAEQYTVSITLASYDEATYIAKLDDDQATALATYTAQQNGTLSYSCEEKPEWCLFSTYSAMTQDELYAYFSAMYTEGLAEGEEGPSELYAAVLLHYAEHHEESSNLLCTCGVHPMPQPGSSHESACPWYKLTEQTVPGTAGSIEGELPDDATASMETAEVQTAVTESILADADQYTGETTIKAFDLKVLLGDGSEWQPESALTITLNGVYDAALTDPIVKLYHLLDTASAITAAQANGTLKTSSDEALVAARPAEVQAAAEAGIGNVVAYTVLNSQTGDITLNGDGSITFKMDSFSTVLTISTEGCDGEACGYNTYAALTTNIARYKYLVSLYDAGNTLEAFLLDMSLYHEGFDDVTCSCAGTDVLVYAPGSAKHGYNAFVDDGVTLCAWKGSTAATADLYTAYSGLGNIGKAFMLAGMDDTQVTEMKAAAAADTTDANAAATMDYLLNTATPIWQLADENGADMEQAIGMTGSTAGSTLEWPFGLETLATIETDDSGTYLVDARYHIRVARVENGMIYPLTDAE